MKKFYFFLIFAVAATLLLPSVARAAFDEDIKTDGMMADQKIIDLSNKYVALVSSLYPEESTRMGTLGYHNALNQRDTQTQISVQQTLTALKTTLDGIDPKKLSTSKRIDYAVLNSMVNKKLFDINVLKTASKDPLWYLASFDSIYDILVKDYASKPDRLRDAIKRMEAFPAVLQEAQRNLDNPVDVKVRMAIEKAKLTYDSFDTTTNLMLRLSEDDYTKEKIKTVSAAAKTALKEYADYLTNLMSNKEYVDFRLGTENYLKLMKTVYGEDIAVSKLQKTLDKEADAARQNLIASLTPVIEPSLTEDQKTERTNKKGVIELSPNDYYLTKTAATKAPALKEVLDTYAKNFKEATKFFKDNKLFPISALQVRISNAPAYLRQKLEEASYIPPFPLLTRQMGDVFVALPDEKDAETVLPATFSYADIKLSAAKYITPGQNLMFSTLPEEGEVMRKISDNIFFINGWLKYSLGLALQSGYFDKDEEKLELAWYNYKKALYAVADFKVHTNALNYTQAVDFLIDAGIDSKEAEAEVDNIAVKPLDAVSYIIGGMEFDRLKTKYQKKFGKDFDLADFHKKVLMSGKIQMSLLDESVTKAYEKKDTVSAFNMTYF